MTALVVACISACGGVERSVPAPREDPQPQYVACLDRTVEAKLTDLRLLVFRDSGNIVLAASEGRVYRRGVDEFLVPYFEEHDELDIGAAVLTAIAGMTQLAGALEVCKGPGPPLGVGVVVAPPGEKESLVRFRSRLPDAESDLSFLPHVLADLIARTDGSSGARLEGPLQGWVYRSSAATCPLWPADIPPPPVRTEGWASTFSRTEAQQLASKQRCRQLPEGNVDIFVVPPFPLDDDAALVLADRRSRI